MKKPHFRTAQSQKLIKLILKNSDYIGLICIILLLSMINGINTKYRTFDYSTNIITANYANNSYAPYKNNKFGYDKSSYKKIESLNVKMYDRNRRNQKILSRNDRIDLFL